MIFRYSSERDRGKLMAVDYRVATCRVNLSLSLSLVFGIA